MSKYDLVMLCITLLSGLLVIYHHIGYPLILRWFRQRARTAEVNVIPRNYTQKSDDQTLPAITILIPAYNEQEWIAEKLHNLAVLDYPSEKLLIELACDGCTDNTALIARQVLKEPECQHLNLSIHEFTENRGKVAVINDLMGSISTELVAFSDVSALISVDSLLVAATRFTEQALGVITGHYQLLNPGSGGESAYWHYQSKIKASEAAIGSTLGAHGAFYIFRRSLFSPLPADTINDDFILPMQIVAQGYQSDYERLINTLELEKTTISMDSKRRRRIAAGNFQQLIRLKNMLLPVHRRIAFLFFSGKGLRVLMPFLMITSFVGSLILAENYLFFRLVFALQLFAYLLSGWQLIFQHSTNKLCQLLSYLVGGHIASLIGTLSYLSGRERGCWKRAK